MTSSEMRSTLAGIPTLLLAQLPTVVEPLLNLSAVLGGGPRLLVKRDDTLGFAFGGNKVRKLALLGARAQAEGCDTLVTAGGLQSNHARVTAATAVKLGMNAVIIVNSERGEAPPHATSNALLDKLLGAQVIYVDNRDARVSAMREAAERLTASGR